MLALTINKNTVVEVGNDIKIIFIKQKGKKEVCIGIEAPKNIKIGRKKENTTVDTIGARSADQVMGQEAQSLS